MEMSTNDNQFSYSMTTFIDLFEFMIDNRRAIICPKCDSLPIFLSSNNSHIINTLCLQCRNIKPYEIQKILDFINPNNFHLNHCNFQKHKINTKSISYCLKCKKWLCKDCYNLHNSINYNVIHHTSKTGPIIQNYCSKHNDLRYEKYCICCDKNLCRECYEKDICPVTQLKHDLMKNDKNTSQYILTNEEINEEIFKKIKIMKDIKIFWKHMEQQKEKIVQKFQEIIYEIEYNFKITYENNKKIFAFFESFLRLFSNGNNYYILKHLQFLSTLPENFPNFDIDNFNSKNIQDYVTYLKKDFSLTFGIKQNKKIQLEKCPSMQISSEPSAFASYNDRYYIGYKNGYIDVCAYVDNQLQEVFSIRKHTLSINQFNHYNEYILSSSKEGIINIWKEVQKEKEFQLDLASTLNVKEELNQVIIFEHESKSFLLTTADKANCVKIWNFSPKEETPEKILTFNSQLQCFDNITVMMKIEKTLLLISTIKETLSLWSIPHQLNVSSLKNIPCKDANHLSFSNNFIFVVGKRYLKIIKMLNRYEESETKTENETIDLNCQLMVLYKFNVELNKISMNDILLFSPMNYDINTEDKRFFERVVLLCRKEIITIIFNGSFDYIVKKENIQMNNFEEVQFYNIDQDKNNRIFQLKRENYKFSGSFLSLKNNQKNNFEEVPYFKKTQEKENINVQLKVEELMPKEPFIEEMKEEYPK